MRQSCAPWASQVPRVGVGPKPLAVSQRVSRRWFRDESPARGDGDDPPCTGCVTLTPREPSCSPVHTRLTRVRAPPPAPLLAHLPTGQAQTAARLRMRRVHHETTDSPGHRGTCGGGADSGARAAGRTRCAYRWLSQRTDWSMNLWVDSGTSWSDLFSMNFLACRDVPMKLTVSVATDVAWSLAGQVTSAGSTTILATFEKSGVGPSADPPVLVPGISMCAHFDGPVTPPDHMYVATGTASVAGSPSPTLPFEVPFRIEPMRSSVFPSRHEVLGGVSAFTGQVTVFTSDGFRRPAPVGTVTLERLEGSSWVKAGETVSASDGNFTVLAGTILQTGSYIRVLYPGTTGSRPVHRCPRRCCHHM